jgi:hypothetical protein
VKVAMVDQVAQVLLDVETLEARMSEYAEGAVVNSEGQVAALYEVAAALYRVAREVRDLRVATLRGT